MGFKFYSKLVLSVACLSISSISFADCLQSGKRRICVNQKVVVEYFNIHEEATVAAIIPFNKKVIVKFADGEVSKDGLDLDKVYSTNECVKQSDNSPCIRAGDDVYAMWDVNRIPAKIVGVNSEDQTLALKLLTTKNIYSTRYQYTTNEIYTNVSINNVVQTKGCVNGLCVGDSFKYLLPRTSYSNGEDVKVSGTVAAIDFNSGTRYYLDSRSLLTDIEAPQFLEVTQYSAAVAANSSARGKLLEREAKPAPVDKTIDIRLIRAIWDAGGYRNETTQAQMKNNGWRDAQNEAQLQDAQCYQKGGIATMSLA